MRNGQRILALDASTTAVGWCVAEGTRYVDSGVKVLPDPGNTKWWDRVTAFSNWLGGLLLGDQDIELVVYEKATGDNRNMHTNRLLGACEYAARCRVRDTSGQRRFETVTAKQVKAIEINKDNLWAAEALIQDATNGKHGLRATTKKHRGDEADAIGVWQAHLRKVGYHQ